MVSCFSFSSVHEFGSNTEARSRSGQRRTGVSQKQVSQSHDGRLIWASLFCFRREHVHYRISYFGGKCRAQHTFWIIGSPPLRSVWFSVSHGSAILFEKEVVDSVHIIKHKGQTLRSVASSQWLIATVFSKVVSKLKGEWLHQEWYSQSPLGFSPSISLAWESNTMVTGGRIRFSRYSI